MVISLLCAVAAVVPLIPVPPPFTSDSSGAAISVDTVGHILYPSGLIAKQRRQQFTFRTEIKREKKEDEKKMNKEITMNKQQLKEN